jgi:hypothetical protein
MTATAVLATGLQNALGGAVALAGTVVLGLVLVALGAYVYRSVRGDGIEWPDDETDGDTLDRGDDDDEWDYY